MTSNYDVLLAIEQHFAESHRRLGCEQNQIGPLQLVRWLDVPMPYFNHATAQPGATAAHARESLAAVAQFYHETHLPAVVEVAHELAPQVLDALRNAGWHDQGSVPLMVWQAAQTDPAAEPGLRIERVRQDQLTLYAHTSLAGFEAVEGHPAWLIRQNERNFEIDNHAYMGWIDDTPVATVELIFSTQAAEITTVTTLPAWRRQGIGAATVNHAVRVAQQMGKPLIFLAAQDERARRLYERLRFRVVGWVSTFQLEKPT